MDVKKDWIGKLLRAFGFAVVIGYLAKLGVMQIFCMIIIIYIFEEFLLELEKPSATKRFFAKVGTIVLLIVSYLAIRVAIGIAFNMPIISAIDTWAGNEGWNKIFPSHTTPVDLGIELFLVLPVCGLALLLVKGKTVGRSVVLVLSTLGFLFLAYQAKQPDHFQSMNRKIDASIAEDTTANHIKAFKSETMANAVFVNFPSGIGEIYEVKTIGQRRMVEQIHRIGDKPVHHLIVPGWSARAVDPKLPTVTVDGVQYLEVFLPNEKGLPANARKIYVNREMVEVTQGPPKPSKNSGDGRYIEVFPAPGHEIVPSSFGTFTGKGYGNNSKIPILAGKARKGDVIVIGGGKHQFDVDGNFRSFNDKSKTPITVNIKSPTDHFEAMGDEGKEYHYYLERRI